MDAPKIEVWFDGSCALCRRAAHWLAARDRDGRLELRDGRAADGGLAGRLLGEMVVVEPDGRVLGGYAALCRALEALPRWGLVARFGKLPPVAWFAGLAYRAVARHRHALSVACGPACAPGGKDRRSDQKATRAVVSRRSSPAAPRGGRPSGARGRGCAGRP